MTLPSLSHQRPCSNSSQLLVINCTRLPLWQLCDCFIFQLRFQFSGYSSWRPLFSHPSWKKSKSSYITTTSQFQEGIVVTGTMQTFTRIRKIHLLQQLTDRIYQLLLGAAECGSITADTSSGQGKTAEEINPSNGYTQLAHYRGTVPY